MKIREIERLLGQYHDARGMMHDELIMTRDSSHDTRHHTIPYYATRVGDKLDTQKKPRSKIEIWDGLASEKKRVCARSGVLKGLEEGSRVLPHRPYRYY